MATTILIVDDHEVVRHGVRAIVQKARPDWVIAAEASSGTDAIEAAEKHRPHVVVMDVSMPDMNGLQASEQILTRGFGTSILIFSMHDSGHLLDEMRRIGVHGFVQKSQAGRDLIRAIEAITSGGTFFGSEVQAEPEPNQNPRGGSLLRSALTGFAAALKPRAA